MFEERLPQRLLLILAATPESAVAAGELARELRLAAVPCLVVAPQSGSTAADLRLPAGGSEAGIFFNRRAWLKRLHPDLVLGADTSRFTRATLLAARSEGLQCLLWSACGRRLPWWTRLVHQCVPRLEAPTPPDTSPPAGSAVARYLKAAVLGLAAGSERLLLSPLAAAGRQALSVKRS